MTKNYFSFLFLLFSISVSAQIHINEYSASNLNSFTDSFQKTEDWIELYNSSDTSIDISGWHLSDKENKPDKYAIPTGTVIPPDGHLVFLCSGRDLVVNGEYHTNFKLAQTKLDEVVLLSDAEANVLEMYPLELTLVESSRCRMTDGSAQWMICTAPTFGTSNDSSPQFISYTQPPIMNRIRYYDIQQMAIIQQNLHQNIQDQ